MFCNSMSKACCDPTPWLSGSVIVGGALLIGGAIAYLTFPTLIPEFSYIGTIGSIASMVAGGVVDAGVFVFCCYLGSKQAKKENKKAFSDDESFAHRMGEARTRIAKLKTANLFFSAIHHDNVDEVKRFIEKEGFDVNSRIYEDSSTSPLFEAASVGSVQVATYLLGKGAEVNVSCPPFNYTPLHMAALQGNTNMINLLKENGADLSATINTGETPYDLARQYQTPRIQALLAS